MLEPDIVKLVDVWEACGVFFIGIETSFGRGWSYSSWDIEDWVAKQATSKTKDNRLVGDDEQHPPSKLFDLGADLIQFS